MDRKTPLSVIDKLKSLLLSHKQYEFLLFLLSNIVREPDNIKYRTVSINNEMVRQVLTFLELMGFENTSAIHPNLYTLKGHYDLLQLTEIKLWLQQRVDETTDPSTMSLAQVAEILQRNGTLPGIDTNMCDAPLQEGNFLSSTEHIRPRKPWEMESDATS